MLHELYFVAFSMSSTYLLMFFLFILVLMMSSCGVLLFSSVSDFVNKYERGFCVLTTSVATI